MNDTRIFDAYNKSTVSLCKFDASIFNVFLSINSCVTPRSLSKCSNSSISLMCGILPNSTGPSTMRAAITTLSATFFEPDKKTSPVSFVPPLTINASSFIFL